MWTTLGARPTDVLWAAALIGGAIGGAIGANTSANTDANSG
jgi:hypothetical protein